jgi:hypothetical protein
MRRGLLWLAALTTLGLVIELAAERHWSQPIQLVAWGAVVAAAAATALLWGAPGTGQVRVARVVAVLLFVSAALGVWEHVESNYDAAPLDYRYADTWDSMSEPSRWWLALSKTVGPSPPLAPGALAQVGLCLMLASLRQPALGRTPAPGAPDTPEAG